MNLIRGSHGFIGSRLKSLTKARDISRSLLLPFMWPWQKPETIYYTASYGNMYTQKDINKTWSVNTMNCLNLSYRLRKQCDLFVYFSSSSVLLPTQTEYSRSKDVAETFLALNGTECLIIRPYSVTGVGEQPEHLIPTAIRCAYSREVMTLDPDPVHDFIDIDDLLAATMVLVWHKQNNLTLSCVVADIGSGKQYTNTEVIKMVEKATGKKIKVKIKRNLRSYDTKHWKSKNQLLKKLGWKPTKTLQQSINEMVEAYDKK